MKLANILGEKIKPEKVYIILALFFGVLFIFIEPPFYVQDEVNHFYRAYQLSDSHIMGEKRKSNFYLISVPSVGKGSIPPIKWTELSTMLVKDQKNNIYLYGFKHSKWKYTKLDSAIFKGIHFPAQNEPPIFLQEQDKKPEIYTEIARKGGLYPIALSQAGGFLPTSIVETTSDLMHHLPFAPYEKENRFKVGKIFSLLHQDLHPEVKTFIGFNNTVLYAPFSYLPQVFGIVVGKFLQLSPVMLLYLARLCAFLCSVTLIYYALKLMPVLKWSMFLLATMPLTFWEIISVSYDNLTISLSFLLIAVFFYYALTKVEIKVFDIVAIFILTFLVSLSKMAYLPLIFLYFLIPIKKIGSLYKYLALFFLLLFANVSLVGIWSALVHKIYVVYVYGLNVDPYAQLLYLWNHPAQIFDVIGRYCSTFGWSYFEQFVGTLGLQTFLLDIYFVTLLIVSFLSDEHDVQLKVGQRIIAEGVFWVNFFVVFLLIYLSSTEVGAHAINGMRQRYLIPFSILFFSMLPYKLSFKIDVGYYKSWLLPIISFVVLSSTLLAMIVTFVRD